MDKLLPCPFCGKKPSVVQRPDSLDGYFCAIACFCGGYSAGAHQFATDKESANAAYDKAKESWNRRAQPENKPLTLDELREMDGEPVWITTESGSGGVWALIVIPEEFNEDDAYSHVRPIYGSIRFFEEHGKTWLAYRYKPEEETQ